MTADDIRKKLPNASAAFIALNASDTNDKSDRETQGQGSKQADRRGAKLECSSGNGALHPPQAKERDSRRFLVRVTSVRARLLDEDNICEKYHVDCCRYAGLLPDDNPEQVKIEAGQRKVQKEEAEHTIVEIYTITDP